MKLYIELYKNEENELCKYYHKSLPTNLLYLNSEYFNYKYEKITLWDLLRKVIEETRYDELNNKRY